MHRTLFTPAMVETFRACKRAYEIAFANYSENSVPAKTTNVCKRYIMRALADINRGKITNVTHIQKHLGQHWPVDVLTEEVVDPENATKAFLFAYKTLTNYVAQPYKPEGASVVACALKVRARIAHVRVYIEDTLDMVLYYPKERRLEIVDFQVQPIKPFDPLWPSPSVLTKQYLAERLKSRWDFDKLTLTFYRAGTKTYQPLSVSLNESIYRVHWLEMIKTLDEMKEPASKNLLDRRFGGSSRHIDSCRLCYALEHSLSEESASFSAEVNEPSALASVKTLTA